MRNTPLRCVVVALPALLAACTTEGPTSAAIRASVSAPANAPLHRLGGALSRSLARSSDLRDWLAAEAGASPYVEYRIALRRILHLDPARRAWLLTRLDLQNAWATDSAQWPELELYFPGREHRASWGPSMVPQVAVPVAGTDSFVIYRAGDAVQLVHEDYHPSEPTLVLGPSEIDYDDSPSALRGGSRSGSAARAPRSPFNLGVPQRQPCYEDCGGGGGGGGSPPSQNSYLTYLNLLVNHDGFFRGSNEVEVFGRLIRGGGADCRRWTDVEPNQQWTINVEFASRVIKDVADTVGSTPNHAFLDANEDDDGACVDSAADNALGEVVIPLIWYDTVRRTVLPNGTVGDVELRLTRGPGLP